jgi:uncharacterized membrane protein HdeD (DUF308 family)
MNVMSKKFKGFKLILYGFLIALLSIVLKMYFNNELFLLLFVMGFFVAVYGVVYNMIVIRKSMQKENFKLKKQPWE